MADALGTPGPPAGPGVVSALDHRLDQAGLIAAQGAGMAVRTGVMAGPGTTTLVTGTSATGTMTYAIAAHHWVSTRGTADGVYLGATEAAQTVSTAAAPGANSRIDVIWERQQDQYSTLTADATSAPEYGVTSGTAAVSPVKPTSTIPVGALELATAVVAAGATSTNGAGVTITQTARQTVARGADIPVRNQAERDAYAPFWPLFTVKRLDTGAIEMRNVGNTAWLTVYDPTSPAWTSFTPTWTTSAPAFPPSIGNGSLTGQYVKTGRKVEFQITLRIGSTTDAGGGAFTIGGLPFTSAAREQRVLCSAYAAGTRMWDGLGVIASGATTVTPYLPVSATDGGLSVAQSSNTAGAAGTGVPLRAGNYSYVSGENLMISGTYEAAS